MSISIIPNRVKLTSKTTSETSTYKGLAGEITHDSTQDTITLHKGDGQSVVMVNSGTAGSVQGSLDAANAAASAALVSEQAASDSEAAALTSEQASQ